MLLILNIVHFSKAMDYATLLNKELNGLLMKVLCHHLF